MILRWGPRDALPPPSPHVSFRVGHFWSNPSISPRFGHNWSKKKKKRFVLIQKKKKLVQFVSLSYFVSIGHILSHLVKFVYFSLILLILCAIYGTFLVGQSSFLIGQSSTKSVKLVKIIKAP